MTSQIVAEPQVSSSPIEEVESWRMKLKEFAITVLAVFRFIFLCYLIGLIFMGLTISDENSGLFFQLIIASIYAIFEMVGLVGVMHQKVCAIRYYIAYGIISYVLYMLTVGFFKDRQQVKPKIMLGQSVFTILYFLMVYFYLQDCNTVRKSMRQQEHQASVVYRA